MKLNTMPSSPPEVTHEGGRAQTQKPAEELERAVATCLLWEDTFYGKGSEIADRISGLIDQVTFSDVMAVAQKARYEWKLRHVPLFLCSEMCRKRSQFKGQIEGIKKLSETIANVIHRPDEMGELISIYWRNGKRPLPKQMRLGIAQAFQKWSEHQLAKWNRDAKVKLRDVLFLTHPRPKDTEQEQLWSRLIAGELAPAGTWEERLSAGEDKKTVFEELLRSEDLGVMALLMNLRNMTQAGVDLSLIQAALAKLERSWALPFRFLTAAKYAPMLASDLDKAMLRAVDRSKKLPGRTILLIDVSGSMDAPISEKSEVNRIQAACGLAILARELCDPIRVFTFSDTLVEVPNLQGFGLAQVIANSQRHSGTYLGKAVLGIFQATKGEFDRIIIITDEQAHDELPALVGGMEGKERGYILNVAPYAPALPTRDRGWTRINGWSERVLDWIRIEEEFS